MRTSDLNTSGVLAQSAPHIQCLKYGEATSPWRGLEPERRGARRRTSAPPAPGRRGCKTPRLRWSAARWRSTRSRCRAAPQAANVSVPGQGCPPFLGGVLRLLNWPYGRGKVADVAQERTVLQCTRQACIAHGACPQAARTDTALCASSMLMSRPPESCVSASFCADDFMMRLTAANSWPSPLPSGACARPRRAHAAAAALPCHDIQLSV